MPRPTKLTDPVQAAICGAIRGGNTRTAAAGFAGVSYDSFKRWFDDNAKFRDAVLLSEAQAEVRNVAIIQTAAKTTWTASAWWLERRRPDDWKKREESTVNVNLGHLSDAELEAIIQAGSGGTRKKAAR